MTPKPKTAGGTLFVVGTPIGNLEDLSPRARSVLGRVDLIVAEDTRRTRRLLSHLGIAAALVAYHEHNESDMAPRLIERLARGETLALVSDAGMPLVSDPGWQLVALAIERGIEVVAVPGPSAVTAALGVSGLPSDRFVFEGFLPRQANARAERLATLTTEPRTLVFFESVHRIAACLDALIAAFGPGRRAVLARELTKLHETVYRGTLEELRSGVGAEIPLRGEFVLLVAGAASAPAAEAAEVKRVYALLSEAMPAGKAVSVTAEITGRSRNEVYRLTRLPEPANG